VRFGVPFTEYDTVFFGIGVEQHAHRRRHGHAEQLLPTTARPYGASSTVVPLTLGWARDAARQRAGAHAGRYQRVNFEWSVGRRRALPAHQPAVPAVLPAAQKLTLGLNGEVGWGKGLGGKPYPVFKNFYGGGLGSVRAFEQARWA
jgi:outer membrane protein insertion porin family